MCIPIAAKVAVERYQSVNGACMLVFSRIHKRHKLASTDMEATDVFLDLQIAERHWNALPRRLSLHTPVPAFCMLRPQDRQINSGLARRQTRVGSHNARLLLLLICLQSTIQAKSMVALLGNSGTKT